MYLSSMFNWKTVGIFAVLLTMLDVILVFSGTMVTAAKPSLDLVFQFWFTYQTSQLY